MTHYNMPLHYCTLFPSNLRCTTLDTPLQSTIRLATPLCGTHWSKKILIKQKTLRTSTQVWHCTPLHCTNRHSTAHHYYAPLLSTTIKALSRHCTTLHPSTTLHPVHHMTRHSSVLYDQLLHSVVPIEIYNIYQMTLHATLLFDMPLDWHFDKPLLSMPWHTTPLHSTLMCSITLCHFVPFYDIPLGYTPISSTLRHYNTPFWDTIPLSLLYDAPLHCKPQQCMPHHYAMTVCNKTLYAIWV